MKFHKLKVGAVLAATLTMLGGAAHAVTVNLVTDDSNVLTTDSLTGFATDGADMVGMVVTANGSSSATWAATGGSSGAANNSDFRVGLGGDSFNTSWSLRVKQGAFLTSLMLDGVPGNTVFDLSTSTAGGSTSGSAAGLNFAAPGSGTVTATYSNIVALTGDSPVGDIFAKLTLDFTGLAGGGLGRGLYSFTQDTDNASTKLVPVNPVPLPAAGWMLLAGLGGIAAMKRRKKA